VIVCCSIAIVIAAIVASAYCVIQYRSDVKDKKILEEKNKAAETEKLANDIKQFKTDVDTLATLHKQVCDKLEKINKTCDTKVDSKELKEITKSIGKIESEINIINIQTLRDSIERVEENLRDNVPETATRVQSVAEKIQSYKSTLTKVSESLDEIEVKLKDIKNKPTESSKKKKEENKKEKNDTILNPTILFN
jgi:DNA repair ATPase RecN